MQSLAAPARRYPKHGADSVEIGTTLTLEAAEEASVGRATEFLLPLLPRGAVLRVERDESLP